MKQRKCKQGKLGFCYDYGNCDDCMFSQMIAKYENKIKKLKAENEKRLKASEEFATKHCYMKCEIAKTLVKEFAEKIKNEVYPFLQAEIYNKKHFITGDLESDKRLENQNIGILKAQDVLSQWFNIKIDELLKEYEK